MPVIFVIHYLTIFLNSIFVKYVIYKKEYKRTTLSHSYTTTITDDGPIFSGIKNITKLGVYIMFFSILSAYAIQFTQNAAPFICCIFEVTCGTELISQYLTDSHLLLLIIMPVLAFGGICGIFQTFCVDTDGITNKKKYLLCRLSAVIICTVLSFIYYKIQ